MEITNPQRPARRTLAPEDLYSLEDYARLRPDFRAQVMAHKEARKVPIGPKGVERRAWVRLAGFDRLCAIADEDLEGEDETNPSSVHFMRFELTPEMRRAVKAGAAIAAGIDHERYHHSVEPVAPPVRDSLAQDLIA